MTPDQFKAAWTQVGDELATFEEGTYSADLPPSTRDFLAEAGLPSDAAPFFSFSPKYVNFFEGMGLPTGLLAIGSDGSGDPVVLDQGGTVFYLNHDDNLVPIYINQGIECLAEALLGYRHLIYETQRRNGPDAFLDGQVPGDLIAEFMSLLRRIDPAATQAGAMWADELNGLLTAGPEGRS